MTSPKTILPDEIKIWIEDEIKNASHVFSIEQICTSLYQHLQENGRVADAIPDEISNRVNEEADKLKNNPSSLANRYGLSDGFKQGATFMYYHNSKEIERLKIIIKELYKLPFGHGIYSTKEEKERHFDINWQQFKTENNL